MTVRTNRQKSKNHIATVVFSSGFEMVSARVFCFIKNISRMNNEQLFWRFNVFYLLRNNNKKKFRFKALPSKNKRNQQTRARKNERNRKPRNVLEKSSKKFTSFNCCLFNQSHTALSICLQSIRLNFIFGMRKSRRRLRKKKNARQKC